MRKLTYEFVKEQFEKESWILESTEYINCEQKLDCICPKGHRHSIRWIDWQQKHRCPYCVGLGKPTIEFIRSEFEKKDWILKSTEYINARQKLNCICPNGHECNISWDNFRHGKGCPYCVGKISNEEIEVRDFVKSLGIKVSPNNRSQIFNPETGYGFELDIFMPFLNKAIEYNGEYWDKSRDMKARGLLKQQLCEVKGVDLLVIWDKEWRINNKKCKDKIMKFMFSV